MLQFWRCTTFNYLNEHKVKKFKIEILPPGVPEERDDESEMSKRNNHNIWQLKKVPEIRYATSKCSLISCNKTLRNKKTT